MSPFLTKISLLLFCFVLNSSSVNAQEVIEQKGSKVRGCEAVEDISNYITPLMSLIVTPNEYNCKKISTRGVIGMAGPRQFLLFPSSFYQNRGWMEYSVGVPVTNAMQVSDTKLDGKVVLVSGVFKEGFSNTRGNKSGKILDVRYNFNIL